MASTPRKVSVRFLGIQHSDIATKGMSSQGSQYGRNNTAYYPIVPQPPPSADGSTNVPLERLLHIPCVKKIFEENLTLSAVMVRMVPEGQGLREEVGRLREELDCVRRVQGLSH